MLLRLDDPAPGIAHVFALPMGGRVLLPLRFYLYGERAPAAASAQESAWQAWVGERFPAASPDQEQ